MKGPKRHMAVAFKSISIVHSHGKCCHEDLTKIYCCTLATTKHCVSVLCYPLILTVRFFFVPHSIIYHLISFIQIISFAFVTDFVVVSYKLSCECSHPNGDTSQSDLAFCIESILPIYTLIHCPSTCKLRSVIPLSLEFFPQQYTFVYIQHLLSHSVRSSGASLGGTSAHGEPPLAIPLMIIMTIQEPSNLGSKYYAKRI